MSCKPCIMLTGYKNDSMSCVSLPRTRKQTSRGRTQNFKINLLLVSVNLVTCETSTLRWPVLRTVHRGFYFFMAEQSFVYMYIPGELEEKKKTKKKHFQFWQQNSDFVVTYETKILKSTKVASQVARASWLLIRRQRGFSISSTKCHFVQETITDWRFRQDCNLQPLRAISPTVRVFWAISALTKRIITYRVQRRPSVIVPIVHQNRDH